MQRTSAFRRRLAGAQLRARISLDRIPRFRSLAALAAVSAILAWSALSVVNAFGTVEVTRSANSAAYEYQYQTPTVVTEIEDAQNHPVTEAPVGSSVHDTVTVSGTQGTPTGTVTFHLFTVTGCSGTSVDESTTLLDGEASSTPTTVPPTGLSYRVDYAGDATYTAATSACESLSPLPTTWSLMGSGTIAGVGQVSFDVSFKVSATGATGTCTVVEPKTRTKIKCLTVSSATLGDGGTTATISGTASVNGSSTTYTIVAHDAGTPGVGADTFSITAGSFSRNGTLTSGNLTIHS
jgi:hypothetical protein